MNKKDEALKMAIEAMEKNKRTHHYCEDTWYSCPKHEEGCADDREGDECNCGADRINAEFNKALQACEEALEQPAQKPVAWLYKRENSSGGWYVVTNYEKEHDNGTRNIQCYDIPLYTHPAPSWQGLSDDEIWNDFFKAMGAEGGYTGHKFARIIEQALKEKNYE